MAGVTVVLGTRRFLRRRRARAIGEGRGLSLVPVPRDGARLTHREKTALTGMVRGYALDAPEPAYGDQDD